MHREWFRTEEGRHRYCERNRGHVYFDGGPDVSTKKGTLPPDVSTKTETLYSAMKKSLTLFYQMLENVHHCKHSKARRFNLKVRLVFFGNLQFGRGDDPSSHKLKDLLGETFFSVDWSLLVSPA